MRREQGTSRTLRARSEIPAGDAPSALDPRTPVVGLVLGALGAIALLLAGETALGALARTLALPRPGRILLGSIVPAVLVLCALCALEARTSRVSLRSAGAALGFGALVPRQLAVVALASLPLLGGMAAIYGPLLATPLRIEPTALLLLLRYFIGAGLMEEAIFRGYLFRHLRGRHGFVRAASVSAGAFALVHLLNLTNGLTTEVLQGVAISVALGAVVTYAMAWLYERGSRSLWGGAVLHTAIDWLNLVDLTPWTARTHAVFITSVVVASAAVFPLAARLLPTPPRT